MRNEINWYTVPGFLGKYYIYMISIFFIGRVSLFVLYFDNFKDSGVDLLLFMA